MYLLLFELYFWFSTFWARICEISLKLNLLLLWATDILSVIFYCLLSLSL